jgi:hypothetical protein
MHRQEDTHDVEMKAQKGRIRGSLVLPLEPEQVIVKGNNEALSRTGPFLRR